VTSNEARNLKLKPCPFCGGKVKSFPVTYKKDRNRVWKVYVACKNKMCIVQPETLLYPSMAVEYWNRRPHLSLWKRIFGGGR